MNKLKAKALDKVLYRGFIEQSGKDLAEAVIDTEEDVCEDCNLHRGVRENCLCLPYMRFIEAEVMFRNVMRIRSN